MSVEQINVFSVLNLIRAYHGKESSMADFCVALLERHRRAQAQRLIQVKEASEKETVIVLKNNGREFWFCIA